MSTECLFHDSEGSFLHVQIPRDMVEKFKNKFKEGRIYSVKNFNVVSNSMPYKTSPLEFINILHKDTKVCAIQKPDFPNLRFRLRGFEDVLRPGVVRDDELIAASLKEKYEGIDDFPAEIEALRGKRMGFQEMLQNHAGTGEKEEE